MAYRYLSSLSKTSLTPVEVVSQSKTACFGLEYAREVNIPGSENWPIGWIKYLVSNPKTPVHSQPKTAVFWLEYAREVNIPGSENWPIGWTKYLDSKTPLTPVQFFPCSKTACFGLEHATQVNIPGGQY